MGIPEYEAKRYEGRVKDELGEVEAARLLSHSLGEEESSA
jgi:hypothetical protein